MLYFIAFVTVTAVILKFVPNNSLRLAFLFYFILLYLIVAGIDGLVSLDSKNINAQSLTKGVEYFTLLIHLPLIIYLNKLDVKHSDVAKAREIFGKDIKHLTNSELHHHLKH